MSLKFEKKSYSKAQARISRPYLVFSSRAWQIFRNRSCPKRKLSGFLMQALL